MGTFFPEGNFIQYKKEFRDYFDSYLGADSRYKKFPILCDVVWSYIRYGSWTNNYFEYKFWEKKSKVRNEFLTWKRARRFINLVNGEKHNPEFREKHLFLTKYEEYIHRDWLYVPNASEQELCYFLQKHSVVMEKYDRGLFGMGISKKKSDEIADIHAYYEYAKDKCVLLEECISECNTLAKLHPSSLNTIRVATYYDRKSDEVYVLGAVLRMGNGGAVVDNARANGLFAAIDVRSGIIMTPAVDFMGTSEIKHPFSGEQVLGITIPLWNSVKDVCCEAARKSDVTRFIGWDVVVRVDSDNNYFVELIEGNDRPGVPTLQVACGKGLYYEVLKVWNR